MNEAPFHKIWEIILSGGPIMAALALLAFMLYRNTIGLLLFVRAPFAAEAAVGDARETRFRLREIVRSQLRYAHTLVVAAPLLGLLGTVMGMLDTFKGLGGDSNQDTTRAVADGVKVALVTTQTGLMIAILGLFLTQWIGRLFRKQDLYLTELELDRRRASPLSL